MPNLDTDFTVSDLNESIPNEKDFTGFAALLDEALQEIRKTVFETKGLYDQEISRLDFRLANLEGKMEVTESRPSPVYEHLNESGRASTRRSSNRKTAAANFPKLRESRAVVEFPFMDEDVEMSNGAPVLTWHLHEAIAQDCIYIFADTIWDSVLFCGLGVMSLVDELIVAFVYLANIIIQGMFIILVSENMTGNVFRSSAIVETMKDWRVLYAHHPDYGDPFTARPLGRDVCELSQFLMQGSGQASLYAEVHDYLNIFFGMPAGAVLCLLSVFLWLLTCWQEIRQVTLFAIGMWTPRDATSSIRETKTSSVEIIAPIVVWEYDEATQKNFQLHICFSRAVVMSFVIILPRLGILLCLCYVGIIFLVSTVELTELILNAVALEVVLNVDELFFQDFLPRMAWRMIRKTMPLRVPRVREVFSTCMSIVKILAVSVILFFVWLAFLNPSVNLMRDTQKVMCDGDLDFFAVQVEYGPVIAMPSTSLEVHLNSFKYEAILQRTGLEDPAPRKIYLEGAPFNKKEDSNARDIMRMWEDRTLSDWAIRFNLQDLTLRPCADDAHSTIFGFDNFPTWASLQSIAGNSSLASCADAIIHCGDGDRVGKVVRLLCPVMCGGANPYSGQAMDEPADGMPSTCKEVSQQAVDRTQELPPYAQPISENCVEYTPKELRELPAWASYYKTVNAKMRNLFYSYEGTNESYVAYWENELIDGMHRLGCDYFAKPRVIELPFGGTQLTIDHCDSVSKYGRSVQPLCPQTCNCTIASSQGVLCPSSCNRLNQLLNTKLDSVVEDTDIADNGTEETEDSVAGDSDSSKEGDKPAQTKR